MSTELNVIGDELNKRKKEIENTIIKKAEKAYCSDLSQFVGKNIFFAEKWGCEFRIVANGIYTHYAAGDFELEPDAYISMYSIANTTFKNNEYTGVRVSPFGEALCKAGIITKEDLDIIVKYMEDNNAFRDKVKEECDKNRVLNYVKDNYAEVITAINLLKEQSFSASINADGGTHIQ